MQLGNDDPFCTVDYESTGPGHQWYLAHVHVLFTDVLDHFIIQPGLLVVDHQAHLYTEGGCIGQSPKLAFLDIEVRSTKCITDIFQHGMPGITYYREY